MIDKSDFLVSSDYNSLYASAMAHLDSNWPEIETAKAVNIEHSDILSSLFKFGSWKSLKKSGVFKVRYYNPKEILFQRTSGKEIVFNDRKKRYELILIFRNGDIIQYIPRVDIEEVVRSGRGIVKNLEGFLCDNLELNPFGRFNIHMTEK